MENDNIKPFYLIESTIKMTATNFANWMDENSWVSIYSVTLKKKAYINTKDNPIYKHGSDYHFTQLIEKHGKTLDELYDMFILDERKRLSFYKSSKIASIFKVLDIQGTTDQIDFVQTIINGGKTDNTERASSICGYLEKEGLEQAVYQLLEGK